MNETDQRYRVVSESTSGHCCFKATVLDTHKPEAAIYSADDTADWYEPVCECFSVEDAEKIACALNAAS